MASLKRKAVKKVAIVAMGASHRDYVFACIVNGGRKALFDEVWTINAMGGILDCDRIFMMDSPEYITTNPNDHTPLNGYTSWLKTTSVPIYTSVPNKEYAPTSIDYPIEFVLNSTKQSYLTNTVSYAIALAISEKVETLSIFGCDYLYDNNTRAEQGRACVEFWLGIAVSRGMKIYVGENSELLNTKYDKKLYAYPEGTSISIDENGNFKVHTPE